MKKGALIAHYAFGKKLELAAEPTEGVCRAGIGVRAGICGNGWKTGDRCSASEACSGPYGVCGSGVRFGVLPGVWSGVGNSKSADAVLRGWHHPKRDINGCCQKTAGGWDLPHGAGEGDGAAEDTDVFQLGVAVDQFLIGRVFRVEDQHIRMIIDPF